MSCSNRVTAEATRDGNAKRQALRNKTDGILCLAPLPAQPEDKKTKTKKNATVRRRRQTAVAPAVVAAVAIQ